jgi:hypothetical protein
MKLGTMIVFLGVTAAVLEVQPLCKCITQHILQDFRDIIMMVQAAIRLNTGRIEAILASDTSDSSLIGCA